MATGFRVSENGSQTAETRPATGHKGRDGKGNDPWPRPIEPASPLKSAAAPEAQVHLGPVGGRSTEDEVNRRLRRAMREPWTL